MTPSVKAPKARMVNKFKEGDRQVVSRRVNQFHSGYECLVRHTLRRPIKAIEISVTL